MKKIISSILTLVMLLSMSVCAADYVAVTDGNDISYYTSLRSIHDLEITDKHEVNPPSTSAARGLYYDEVRVALAAADKEFGTDATNIAFDVGDNTNNTITVVDKAFEDDTNTYSIELKTTSDGKASECQMNNLPIYAEGGITVVQNDFCLSALPESVSTIVSRLHYGDKNSTTYSSQTVMSVTAGGKIEITGKITDVTIQPDRWYTATQVVFQDENKVDFYLDGTYLGTNNSANSFARLYKFTASNGKKEAKTTYLDNFKVFKATDELVTLRVSSDGSTIVEGTPVTLTADNLNEDVVKSVRIESSTDGINYSIYANSANAFAYYKSYTTYYKAVAFDADGNKLSETEPVVLATNYVKDKTHWDVDFETPYTLKYGTSTTSQSVHLSTDGGSTACTNDYDQTFVMNLGNPTIGSIKLEEVSSISNNQNGKSLILDNSADSAATPTNEVQINSGNLVTTDRILVTEFDFAFSELPKKKSNSVMRLDLRTESGTTTNYENATILVLTTGGKLQATAETAKYVSAVPNKWYHIRQVVNLTSKSVDFYVDDEILASTSFNSEYVKIQKFSSAIEKNNNNTLYYDNFKIYSVAEATPSLKIKSVDYYIDGAPVHKIAAGNLTAEIMLSNNGAVNENTKCIAAVYSANNELASVSVNDVSFAASETAKLISLDLGTVAADNSVKIFFWSDLNNVIPNGTNNGLTAN